MKSKKTKSVKQSQALTEWFENDETLLPPAVETDATSRLLDQLQSRTHHAEASPYFTDDLDEHDFLSEEALHRVVEDLQFGQDQRL